VPGSEIDLDADIVLIAFGLPARPAGVAHRPRRHPARRRSDQDHARTAAAPPGLLRSKQSRVPVPDRQPQTLRRRRRRPRRRPRRHRRAGRPRRHGEHRAVLPDGKRFYLTHRLTGKIAGSAKGTVVRVFSRHWLAERFAHPEPAPAANRGVECGLITRPAHITKIATPRTNSFAERMRCTLLDKDFRVAERQIVASHLPKSSATSMSSCTTTTSDAGTKAVA